MYLLNDSLEDSLERSCDMSCDSNDLIWLHTDAPMMESSESHERQPDVFGEWDCNDNTPVLTPQVSQEIDNSPRPREVNTIMDSQPSFPLESSGDTLSGADPHLPPLPDGLLQLEDNSNTEFYYDDDYSLQYDANLAEVDMDMLDAVDLNTLLSLSRIPVDDNNSHCARGGMPASKSDSCLYQLGSSGEPISSQEHSVYSDQELCVSSGELSDIQSDPLFSPPPPNQETPCLSVDSLAREGDLVTSFLSDKFRYDWTANKNQYMLSFDRSPNKCSSEESYGCALHGSMRGSLNISKHMANSRGFHSSNDNQHDPAGGRLVTWKTVRNQSPPEQSTQLTSWKVIHQQSESSSDNDGSFKCPSMPDLWPHKSIDSVDSMEDRHIWSRVLMRAVSEGGDPQVLRQKMYSGSLVDLFQQEQGYNFAADEAMVSPPESLPGVNSIWSMSGASSDKSLHKNLGKIHNTAAQGLVTWDSLMKDKDHKPDKDKVNRWKDKPPKDMATQVTQYESCMKENKPPPTTREFTKPNKKLTHFGKITPVKDKREQSVQWSPSVRDKSVQTSTDKDNLRSVMDKSMQTSFLVKVVPQLNKGKDIILIDPSMKSNLHLKAIKPKCKMGKRMTQNLSNSLFYSRETLPDLSFLNRPMGQSATYAKQSAESPPESQESNLMKEPAAGAGRESSPGLSMSRTSCCGSRPGSDSLSNNASTCSSSSSGIDPGSVDSHGNRCRCRHFSPGLSDNDQHLASQDKKVVVMETAGKTHCLSVSKVVQTICKNCHAHDLVTEGMPGMVASHPVYSKQTVDSKQKCLEYLQLSPIHELGSWNASPPGDRKLSQSETGCNDSEKVPTILCEEDSERPLKPILVSKKKNRAALRYRSMSDPFDLTINKAGPSQVVMRPKIGVQVCKKENRKSWPIRAADTKYDEEGMEERMPLDDYAVNKCTVPGDDVGASLHDDWNHSYASSDTTLVGDSDTSDSSRAKKSVSFSEHVSYHSPYSSPHQSPKKQLSMSTEIAPDSELSVNLHQDWPPTDFMVSPSSSPPPMLPPTVNPDLTHKKELVKEVMLASEHLLLHFSSTRHAGKKADLGSTVTTPAVGQLVLQHLCPALQALLLDGLQPHLHSFFGKVANSLWQMVQDSAYPGPGTSVFHNLILDLKNLCFLDTSWLRFNAFVFGLLNYKILDYWLSHIHGDARLLSKHYMEGSFLRLSGSVTRPLFLDLMTALQPLGQLPFRLEYNFEFRLMQRRQQEQMASYLLQKHVADAENTLQEGQQGLQQRENLQALKNTPSASTGPEKLVQLPSRGQNGHPQKDAANQSEGPVTMSLQLAPKEPATKEVQMLKSASLNVLSKVHQKTAAIIQGPGKQMLQIIQQKATSATGAAVHQVAQSVTLRRSSSSLPNISAFTEVLAQAHAESVEDRTSPGDANSEAAAKPKLQPIIREGEFVTSEYNEDSDGELEQASVTLSNQRAYKAGVTDYQFDSKRLTDSAQSTKSLNGQHSSDAAVILSNSKLDIVDKHIKSPEAHTVEFRIPARTCQTDNTVRGCLEKAASVDSPLRLKHRSHAAEPEKKRWSLGPAVVSFFDKLLLPSSHSAESLGNGKGDTASDVLGKVKAPSAMVQSDTNCGEAAQRVSQWLPASNRQSHSTAADQPNSSISRCDGNLRYVKALCHQLATDNSQLSFQKGDVLQLVTEGSSDWMLCRHGDKEGYVHRASVLLLNNVKV